MAAGATYEATTRGQAVYTPLTLRFYDLFVLGFSNRWIWKCPTRELRRHYEAHLTANHLEVGPGTGYFLDRCRFPADPRLVLLDPNPHCLDVAAERVRRYKPKRLRKDVLQRTMIDGQLFESIGLNYVLHCLPGDLRTKAVAIDNLKRMLYPGGTLFGSTLLGSGVRRGLLARGLSRFYNRRGIFSNAEDSLQDLMTILSTRFNEVEVRTVGVAALFAARDR